MDEGCVAVVGVIGNFVGDETGAFVGYAIGFFVGTETGDFVGITTFVGAATGFINETGEGGLIDPVFSPTCDCGMVVRTPLFVGIPTEVVDGCLEG
jgi:hypothetical protein